MKRLFLPFILLAAFAAQAAYCEPSGVEWGTQVSRDYDVWEWLTVYGQMDEDTWRDLDTEERSSAVKKAESACRRAGAKLAATRSQTDAKAILALTDTDLDHAGSCIQNGEPMVTALRGKKARLADIQRKADQGRYDDADMAWLKANNIAMPRDEQKASETEKKLKEKAKLQEKKTKAAMAKYGKMKGLDAAGLDAAYDNAKSKAPGTGEAALDLSGKRPGNFAAVGNGPRDPKKKLTSTAPPGMDGKPADKGITWNGRKLPPEKQAQVEKCRAQKCSLMRMLEIVDPEKLKAKYDYKKPASPGDVAKMERDFKALTGRKLNLQDLKDLRDDDHGPATGYEGNTLAALEHKYFVDAQVADAVASCPKTPGLYHGCYALKAAVLRGASPMIYEYGKSYMDMERKAAAGDPLAMAQSVITAPILPLNLAVKTAVIGSKNGIENTTWKTVLLPANKKDMGSGPSAQNVLCAMGIFCGD